MDKNPTGAVNLARHKARDPWSVLQMQERLGAGLSTRSAVCILRSGPNPGVVRPPF